MVESLIRGISGRQCQRSLPETAGREGNAIFRSEVTTFHNSGQNRVSAKKDCTSIQMSPMAQQIEAPDTIAVL